VTPARPGYIPLNQLTLIPGYKDIYLQPEAALQFVGLAAHFLTDRKNTLVAVEGYRPMDPTPGLPGSATGYFFARYRKVNFKTGIWYAGSYWQKLPGVPAAGIPGTSFHLTGNAMDVDIYQFSSEDYKALERLAPLYGFSLAQGVADGEPWHIVYVGRPRIIVSSLEVTKVGLGYFDAPQGEKEALVNDVWENGVLKDRWKSGVVGDDGKPTTPKDQLQYAAARISQLANHYDNNVAGFLNKDGIFVPLSAVLNETERRVEKILAILETGEVSITESDKDDIAKKVVDLLNKKK
jgi:hypothetical protein